MFRLKRWQRQSTTLALGWLLTLLLVIATADWLLDWLMSPSSLVTLLLLLVSGLPWIARSRRWQRWATIPVIFVLGVYLLGTCPPVISLAGQGLTLWLPPDANAMNDAIVVVGRGGDLRISRTETAAQLFKEGRASQIFISGMGDVSEIREMLTEMGVPMQAISGEKCSQDTNENALFTSALLYPQGLQKILLVTDPPHLLRSHLIFSSFGFDVTPYPSGLPANWTPAQQFHLLLREYSALAWYALRGKFQTRSASKLEHPPAEILDKIVSWGCEVTP